MKIDFLYSTDFLAMNAPELGHTCMHLLCRAGEGSFVFNERCYHIVKNDLVVLPNPTRAKNLAAAPGMEVEWFAADHRLRDRLDDRHLLFYREMMGSLCLTMMYDIFELHARRDATDTHSDRTAIIVRQLTDLLATGISRTERDVSYYAERLNVSTKYLSATVKRVTGHSVSSFIDRATVPILKKYLNNERLSLTQIADRMNFTSLSYFSRYCTKHLGQSPSDYRRSLQPKEKLPGKH